MQKRKVILLSALILSGFQIFSQEKYRLDEILKMMKNKSKTNIYYEVEKQQKELKEEEAKQRTKNGIETKLSTYKNKTKEKYGNLHFTEKSKYINLTNKYDMFSSEIVYDIEKEKLENNKVGLEKNLTEFINSERKKDIEVGKIEQKIVKLERRIELKDELAAYLSKLSEYILIEKEIEKREMQYLNLNNEKNLIKKSVEFGDKALVDLDYSTLQLEIVKSEINSLGIKREKYLEIIKEKTGKDISIKNIDIPRENDIRDADINVDKIGSDELMVYEYQIEVLEKERELSDFNNKMPEVQLYGKKDIESKDYEIGISFSKAFFNKDYSTKSIELNKKKMISKKLNYIDEIRMNRKEAENYYLVLKSKYHGLLKELEYEGKEQKRFGKLYEIKEISYTEYIEKKNRYVDKEIEMYSVLYEMYIFAEKLKLGRY